MSGRDSNSRYPQRGHSRSGKYSTLTSRKMSQRAHREKYRNTKTSVTIGLILVLILVCAGLYSYFNWDQVVSLSKSFSDDVINTATPVPTSMPSPTPTLSGTATPAPTVSPNPEPTTTPRPDIIQFTISVVGDINYYYTQLADALDEDTGTYDFSHNFEHIAPFLNESDLVMGNFNSAAAGKELEYSGDPSAGFNTPESALEALSAAGFDVLLTANRHMFDQGWVGVQHTQNNIREAGMLSTGTYLSEAEYYKPLFVTIEGVKIAILNYASDETVDVVAEKITKSQLDYAIKKLKMSSVQRDVNICKEANVDLIFAYVNWGTPGSRAAETHEKNYAEAMMEAGIDAIFGAYPQVLQSVTIKTVKRKDGSSAQGLVAYSLGSFITSQRSSFYDSSIVLNVTYEHNQTTDEVTMVNCQYLPTWISMEDTDTENKNYSILPVGTYIDNQELFSQLNTTSQARLRSVWSETTGILGETIITPIR